VYKIVQKRVLNPTVTMMVIEAPYVVRKAQAGQFVVLRVTPEGERIPLTIADYDREMGLLTIIFQKIGKTTEMLGALNEGDCLEDLSGPLGVPSNHQGIKNVCLIGGGLGCAIAYPQAKALFEGGAHVDMIVGFRDKGVAFFLDEMAQYAHRLIVMTDDGSLGGHGFVTDALAKLIAEGNKYDAVIAIGPTPMMKNVCLLTKQHGVKTIVSLNPIMVDGTGMCGCCRVEVGGETKFACVDGPEFDGHEVNFDLLQSRLGLYKEQEERMLEEHRCRLTGERCHG